MDIGMKRAMQGNTSITSRLIMQSELATPARLSAVHEGDARPSVGVAGIPLLRLLQLASPALPIGAFAYSQGLEQAIALSWVNDERSAQEWIQGLLSRSLATLDLPILVRLYSAFEQDDEDAARRWSEILLASRGSTELQAEDRQLGASLARVLDGLGVEGASRWMASPAASHAALFALAAVRWNIPLATAVAAFAFAWTEAQVAAATRLCPLGQQSAQRILLRSLPLIDRAASGALAFDDQDVGASVPAQAIASALHETLYSRLCRS
jgi:urease accessory protein